MQEIVSKLRRMELAGYVFLETVNDIFDKGKGFSKNSQSWCLETNFRTRQTGKGLD